MISFPQPYILESLLLEPPALFTDPLICEDVWIIKNWTKIWNISYSQKTCITKEKLSDYVMNIPKYVFRTLSNKGRINAQLPAKTCSNYHLVSWADLGKNPAQNN